MILSRVCRPTHNETARRSQILTFSDAIRQEGPCKHELAESAPVLAVLVSHAPNGFPNHKNLTDIITVLQTKWNVFELPPGSDANIHALASNASDIWRLKLKHCLDLKKAKRQVASETLQVVLDSLTLSTCESSPPPVGSPLLNFPIGSDGYLEWDAVPTDIDGETADEHDMAMSQLETGQEVLATNECSMA